MAKKLKVGVIGIGAFGSKIALLDESGGTAIVDADGTGKVVRWPSNDAVPVWSPDGSWVALDDGYELTTVKADGSGYRQLLSEGGSSTPWTWSGDNRIRGRGTRHRRPGVRAGPFLSPSAER